MAALIELVRATGRAPTSRSIAERAGISERTLFQHFPDLESLHAAVADWHIESVRQDHVRIDPSLPLSERVRRFVNRRAAVLERMTPLRRVALRYETDSPALQASRRRWAELARRDFARVFAAELPTGRGRLRSTVVAAGQAATSWSAWEELRTVEGLSTAAAAAAMELVLLRLLSE